MSIRIPIARPLMGEPEWSAVRDVIESGWVTQGPKVVDFEHAVADVCGAAHGVAASSCTTALHLALVAAGVEPGDEVICPSMSFIATANAIRHAGATPVFAEVHPDTFNLDADDVERRISDRTRAILLVHQLGLPADIDRFAELAGAHGLALVEDAACAIGSKYRGAPIGSHSDFVCFSFHPRKLVTTGDGGMVLTRSEAHASRLRRLRQHGMDVSDVARHSATEVTRASYTEVGFNYRLTDIQAAVGIEQLKRLDSMVAERQRLARRYDAALGGHGVIRTPVVPDDVEWNVQTYTVRLDGFDVVRRDSVMQSLLDIGIATRAGVMTAHREPAYAHQDVSLPVSEAASDGSMALPLYPGLEDHELDEVASALLEAVGRA